MILRQISLQYMKQRKIFNYRELLIVTYKSPFGMILAKKILKIVVFFDCAPAHKHRLACHCVEAMLSRS